MKRKTLLIVAGFVVVLALAIYIGLEFVLGSAVRAGVNKFGPMITQTRLELDGARLSPLTGTGTLTGLRVGNPKGWSDGNAFSFGQIHVDVAPGSIFGDHIVVNEITITDPMFDYETHLVSSNIGDLLKNIEGTSDSGTAAQAQTKSGKPMKFVVKKLRLTGGKVRLGVGAAAMTLPMPPISLDNIGAAEGGVTSGQLALAVMRSMATGVVSATTQAAGKVGATMGAAAGSAAGKAADGIKSLFGGKK